jgi:hypothetical protein
MADSQDSEAEEQGHDLVPSVVMIHGNLGAFAGPEAAEPGTSTCQGEEAHSAQCHRAVWKTSRFELVPVRSADDLKFRG